MINRILQGAFILLFSATVAVSSNTKEAIVPVVNEVATVETIETIKPVEVVEAETITVKKKPEIVEFRQLMDESSTTVEEEPEYWLTDEEIELIALLTMAEAEGESELGKRLVIDVVLNRMDSELRYMPDTVYDVIYQKNQFTSMWGARVEQVDATEEVIELVKEELINRTDYEVLWFKTKDYHKKYGEPIRKEGGHYFSGFKGGDANE